MLMLCTEIVFRKHWLYHLEKVNLIKEIFLETLLYNRLFYNRSVKTEYNPSDYDGQYSSTAEGQFFNSA